MWYGVSKYFNLIYIFCKPGIGLLCYRPLSVQQVICIPSTQIISILHISPILNRTAMMSNNRRNLYCIRGITYKMTGETCVHKIRKKIAGCLDQLLHRKSCTKPSPEVNLISGIFIYPPARASKSVIPLVPYASLVGQVLMVL